MALDIGYDIDNMKKSYNGEAHIDHYGRVVPIAIFKITNSSHNKKTIPYNQMV